MNIYMYIFIYNKKSYNFLSELQIELENSVPIKSYSNGDCIRSSQWSCLKIRVRG